MSDPITNVEIEDVLASIRRLVSTGDSNQRPGTKKREQQHAERLVLTPALRVTDPPKPEPANAHIAPWGPFSATDDDSEQTSEETAPASADMQTAEAAEDMSPSDTAEAEMAEAIETEDTAGLTLTADDLAEDPTDTAEDEADAAWMGSALSDQDDSEAEAETAEGAGVDADDEEAVGALLADVMAAVQVSNASASFGPIAATVALAERRQADEDSDNQSEPTAVLDAGMDRDEVEEAGTAEVADFDATVSDLQAADVDPAAEVTETDVAPETAAEDIPVEAETSDEIAAETAAELAELDETADTADDTADDGAAVGLAAAGVGAFAAGSAAARAPDIASTVRKSIEEAIAELEARTADEDDEFEPDGSEPPLLPRLDEDQSLHDLVTSEDDEPQEVLRWDDEITEELIPEPETAEVTETRQMSDRDQALDAVRSFLSSDDGLSAADDEVAEAEAEAEPVASAPEIAPAEAADLMPQSAEAETLVEDAADAAFDDATDDETADDAPSETMETQDDAVSAEVEAASLLEGHAEDATAALYPTASEDEDTTADPEDTTGEASALPLRSPFGRIPQMARAAFTMAKDTPEASVEEEAVDAAAEEAQDIEAGILEAAEEVAGIEEDKAEEVESTDRAEDAFADADDLVADAEEVIADVATDEVELTEVEVSEILSETVEADATADAEPAPVETDEPLSPAAAIAEILEAEAEEVAVADTAEDTMASAEAPEQAIAADGQAPETEEIATDDIHQFATVRGSGAPQRGNQIAASPELDDDSTIAALYEQDNFLDEEALRDLVGDIVREELQGVLGERITRNVRKLVRREIHRILNSQDFD